MWLCFKLAHASLCRAAAVGEGEHEHRKVSDDCRCLRQEGGGRGRGRHRDGERVGGVEVHLGGRLLLHLQTKWIQRAMSQVGGCFILFYHSRLCVGQRWSEGGQLVSEQAHALPRPSIRSERTNQRTGSARLTQLGTNRSEGNDAR